MRRCCWRQKSLAGRSSGPTNAPRASCRIITAAITSVSPNWPSTRTASSSRCGSTGYGNAGAYIYPPMPATTNAVKNLIDVYKTPAMEVNSKIVFTNCTPIAAYRGAGRPEGNYFMERLIETAAREIGIDSIELRRRNHIAPEADAVQVAGQQPLRSGASSAPSSTRRWRSRTGTVSRRARPRARSAASCAAAASAATSR